MSYEHALLEAVAKAVEYNPETGSIRWLPRIGEGWRTAVWNAKHAGQEAGSLKKRGYRRLSVVFDGKRRLVGAHRLAWFILTGLPPVGEVDHINHITSDNRAANLRDVTCLENQRNKRKYRNNTTGVTGVYWSKRYKKWHALAMVVPGGSTRKHIGSYSDIAEAEAAVRAFRVAHGYAESHGT